MELKYYELTCTVYLKTDIYFNEAQELIGEFINAGMALDEKLREFHKSRGYKFYVFNSLYPLEKDKTYKKGNVYVFKIRALENDFANNMTNLLPKVNSQNFKLLAVQKKKFNKKHISEINTQTPVIITIDNGPWKKENGIKSLLERLEANLQKKYKEFYKEELQLDNFIQRVEIINSIPIATKYKTKKMLGNKLKLIIDDNSYAQSLAFLAQATGIGEKNSSIGAGFCNSF